MAAAPHNEVDHLFRHEYAKIVSALTARYSPQKIDQIEDAVQEALYKAMKTWSFTGPPAKPSAWLYRVASNHLLDQLRRESRENEIQGDWPVQSSVSPDEIALEGEIGDEQLKMLFAVCHPALKLQEQVMLSLKLLGGLSTREIARAMFKQTETVKKALSRARDKFRKKVGRLDVPQSAELQKRLDAVLSVLYLMFSEGYKATDGDALIRKDICEEAIRLGLLLNQHPTCSGPNLKALLALMCMHTARFEARTDSEGRLVTLENQDRSKWNAEYISYGLFLLNDSVTDGPVSKYHLLAGMAAHYLTAKSYAETDWKSILQSYDLLIQTEPSPAAALNRLVVVAKVRGPEQALKELKEIPNLDMLQDDYMLYVIQADLLHAAGNLKASTKMLRRGIELTGNRIEREFLKKKLDRIN